MISTEKPWVETRLPIIAAGRHHLHAPLHAAGRPYLGTLPVIITAALIFMTLSGFVLSIYYNPAHAFSSIQFIDRDVNSGWLVHAFHTTGTTMIFGAVYLSLFRSLFIRDYRGAGDFVWLLSVMQFLLLLVVGYLGYVLADGAVSYWSLNNVLTAGGALGGLPGVLQAWFFGGPYGAGTLARLAVFHVALSLGIFGILYLYFTAKRAVAPAVPTTGRVSFHPYYTAQYFAALAVFALIFGVLLFFAPHLGSNPLNLAEASPIVVPVVVTPPWYLLPVSAVANVFQSTWAAIIAVVAMLAVLLAQPWLDRSSPAAAPGGLYKFLVVVLALDVIALSLAAAAAPSMITAILGVLFTVWYFLHFLVLTPLVTAMEAK